MDNENKAYRIITDPRIARMILKSNSGAQKKYCAYCGKSLNMNCGCAQDSVLADIKPNKYNAEATVFCFENNDAFKKAYTEVEAVLSAKAEKDPE